MAFAPLFIILLGGLGLCGALPDPGKECGIGENSTSCGIDLNAVDSSGFLQTHQVFSSDGGRRRDTRRRGSTPEEIAETCAPSMDAGSCSARTPADESCVQEYAPINITVDGPSNIMKALGTFSKVTKVTKNSYNLIKGTVQLFSPKDDGGRTPQEEGLDELFAQTQQYVAQEISVSQLNNLYNEIMGYQLQVKQANTECDIWLNAGPDKKAAYERQYESTLASIITILRGDYYVYACSTPWNDGGQDGYGIYFSQYVSLYTTMLMQYITSFPSTSLAKRSELLDLAIGVVPHAKGMYDNYIAQRLSHISPGSQSCESCSKLDTQAGCDTGFYKFTDTYPKYDQDGRTTETCTWSLYWDRNYIELFDFHSPVSYRCGPCPDQASVYSAAISCDGDHIDKVLSPIIDIWDRYLLSLARSIAEIGKEVCDKSPPDSNLDKKCNRLETLAASLPSTETAKAYPERLSQDMQAGAKVQCAADYGTAVGGPVCCGQAGEASTPSVICPKETPTCTGYKLNHNWGFCTTDFKALAPTTQKCKLAQM